jgi:hypothetical protein
MELDTRSLRAIGQDLEKAGVANFDIHLREGKCQVFGLVSQSALASDKAQKPRWFPRRILRRIWLSLARIMLDEPVRFSFERSYGSREVERLDVNGRAVRRSDDEVPDHYTVSQILRVVGEYVAEREGTVSRLRKDDRYLIIEYVTKSGDQKTEEVLISSLYDFGLEMYFQRSENPSNAE